MMKIEAADFVAFLDGARLCLVSSGADLPTTDLEAIQRAAERLAREASGMLLERRQVVTRAALEAQRKS